ncbi:MAG: haloacid dehalogenase type II [Anaerolineae bacterium]|nr:haloacid dehalogenase type II [Anaerolineae bacterium]
MPTIVFDVNETLLDLAALDTHFERIFGHASVKGDWFKQVLQSALVATIIGQTGETDFGQMARIALEMTALRQNVVLTDDDRQAILATMLNLPPHPEVPDALQKLKDAGIRIAALTNSSQTAANAQLTNAKLVSYFDKIISVQSCGKFKPALEVYQMAMQVLDEAPENLWLVAAHDWDIAGAQNAGWQGAFVARRGMVVAPQVKQPEIIGKDMTSVVDQLLNIMPS